ncbi:MAG: hypothetical protein KDA49_09005 [Rhodospirillaceae bacterium]|nr:hypothetical protein [Rhodospirillaceae bacterium]MCA8932592.1 hypothetical protein [Rhodospirillaceae bacterium]
MKLNTLKTGFAALATVVALSACVPNGNGGFTGFNPNLFAPQNAPAAPTLPTFAITTHTGSTETVNTTFSAGTAANPGAVRVCLNNQRPGHRSINLNLGGVNAMTGNGRNTQSCVSVGSNQTVNLTAEAGNRPAHISPSTLNLSQYDGGLLTLVWN